MAAVTEERGQQAGGDTLTGLEPGSCETLPGRGQILHTGKNMVFFLGAELQLLKDVHDPRNVPI